MTEADPHPLVAKAILALGSQKALAEAAGLSQQFISKLLLHERGISAETAISIDNATKGEVSKEMLRPDLWKAIDQATSHAA